MWLEVARISWKCFVKITAERRIGQKWKTVISVLSGSFGFPDRSRLELKSIRLSFESLNYSFTQDNFGIVDKRNPDRTPICSIISYTVFTGIIPRGIIKICEFLGKTGRATPHRPTGTRWCAVALAFGVMGYNSSRGYNSSKYGIWKSKCISNLKLAIND